MSDMWEIDMLVAVMLASVHMNHTVHHHHHHHHHRPLFNMATKSGFEMCLAIRSQHR